MSWPMQRRPTASWPVTLRWTRSASWRATTPAPPPSRRPWSHGATIMAGSPKWRKGVPQLEAALPISADIAALAEIGLDALAAVESKHPPSTDWRDHARELLDRQAAAEKASESIVQILTMEQPAADLLISITPGVRKLVEAAMSLGR